MESGIIRKGSVLIRKTSTFRKIFFMFLQNILTSLAITPIQVVFSQIISPMLFQSDRRWILNVHRKFLLNTALTSTIYKISLESSRVEQRKLTQLRECRWSASHRRNKSFQERRRNIWSEALWFMPLRLRNKNAKMTVAQNLLAPFVSEKVLAAFLLSF